MWQPALRHSLLAISMMGVIACSPGAYPPEVTWINAGLSVTLQNNVAAADHSVLASLQNNTGGHIEFGPPECGDIEAYGRGQWHTARTSVYCEAVVISLDDGKSYPFEFSVPATPGVYRLVTRVVNASDQFLTVRSEGVIAK
jgi:hypothetical protein